MKRNHSIYNASGDFEENDNRKKRTDEKLETNSESHHSKVNCCDSCGQKYHEVVRCKGAPIGSEDEIITVTYGQLSITEENEKLMYKLTDFTVYDKREHICRFDTGLIEAGKTLTAYGFVKHVCDEDPSRMNGVPTSGIGPLEQWFIAGFDGGEKAIVGFSTKIADYYLVEPSFEYRSTMYAIDEKKNLTKLVIEFLLDHLWQSPSYELLLQWVESHNVQITEETLLSHAQFICDQVMSFDAAGNSYDDVLITTPCMRTLVEKADVTLKTTQHVRKFGTKPGPRSSNVKSTPLVRGLFKEFFENQIDKVGNTRNLRRDRCGVCPSCQTPDCGNCGFCHNMRKFGGAGSSKQSCEMRRCSKFQDAREDSDSESPSKNSNTVDKVQSCSKWIIHNVHWIGKQIVTRCRRTFYTKARVGTIEVAPLDYVMLKSTKQDRAFVVAQVVNVWRRAGEGMFHARLFCRGNETVLGETANPRELFMISECVTCPLGSILRKATVERRYCRKDWARRGGLDKLPSQLEDDGRNFFYSKFYDSKSSRFEDIVDVKKPMDVSQYIACSSCRKRRVTAAMQVAKFKDGTVHWAGGVYKIGTAVFLEPNTITFKKTESSNQTKTPRIDKTMYSEIYRKPAVNLHGSDVETPDPFSIGLIENIYVNCKKEIQITVRKFYRPEDTRAGVFLSYTADLNLLYWSAEVYNVNFTAVKEKCYLAYGNDLNISLGIWIALGPHRFYFTEAYDRNTCEYFKVPEEAKQIGVKKKIKGKGKAKAKSYRAELPPKPKETEKAFTCVDLSKRRAEVGEGSSTAEVICEAPPEWGHIDQPLACMDVFSGCGGLSEGLRQAGVAEIKWAIDKDPNAAHAFKLNNPDCTVYTDDCNELLYKIMTGKKFHGRKLPQKGEVEMLVGGPPCQGFSGMNRYNNSRDSAFNNSLIVAFLSYCDYYRPRHIVIENVRELTTFEQGVVFKLTLCCLLTLGYQVTFGVLQAGNYGTPQSRRRLFIMAAAPGCILPKFPEPQNTFNAKACQLAVKVGNTKYYTGAQWWASAPYRTLTVRDAIADLPDIESGSNLEERPYNNSEAVSHFQRMMRSDSPPGISDHICKEVLPLVQSRIAHIPLARGSDWRDLPNIVVELSDGSSTNLLEYNYRCCRQRRGPARGVCACSIGGACDPNDRQVNTLIPWSLPHTANRHNHWAGVYGRLDWDGYFSTTVTMPEPMGKQGKVLHPEQHRIISVRECARSQGFPDSFRFYGSIADKHRQIGNAVPPPLAAALGREIEKSFIFSINDSP